MRVRVPPPAPFLTLANQQLRRSGPTSFQAEFSESTTVRFAMLMRALCERNGGAFVGLNSLEP